MDKNDGISSGSLEKLIREKKFEFVRIAEVPFSLSLSA